MITRFSFAQQRSRIRTILLSGCTLLALSTLGCSDDPVTTPPSTNEAAKYNSTVPVNWIQLQLLLVAKTPGWTPPVASRAFGYVGVAVYEAVVPGMADHRSLVGQLNDFTSVPQVEAGKEYNWAIVANAALARITKSLWGNATDAMKSSIDSLEAANLAINSPNSSQEIIDRSVAHGRAVADAVFTWSKSDNGDAGYTKNFPASYVSPTGKDSLWVPTSAQLIPLQPYWGQNRPFVLPKGGDPNIGIDPGVPISYSTDPSSAFYKEANEVYTTGKALTTEQKNIALFWADGSGTCTPPGHSMSILCQCFQLENSKLDFAVEAYAKMGIGQADAFISCWATKYKYNLLRPITYIKKYIDSTFTTEIATPPFPEYTSGHSTQSGAMSVIMTQVMGSNFTFTDHTHDAESLSSRTYPSFEAAAQETALSRLYGGIHFRAANERGLTVGKAVGQKVLALKFLK